MVDIPDSMAYQLAGLQRLDFSTGDYAANLERALKTLDVMGVPVTFEDPAQPPEIESEPEVETPTPVEETKSPVEPAEPIPVEKPPQKQTPADPPADRKMGLGQVPIWAWIAGGVVILGGLIFGLRAAFGSGSVLPAATLTPTKTKTATKIPATATKVPTATDEPTPTATKTLPPTKTPTPSITLTPTFPTDLYVRINEITIEGSNYVVEYETFGFTEVLPGTHIHFFYNHISMEEGGFPAGNGQWKLYGGPRPFTGYSVSSRPSGADQMCARVANSDHSLYDVDSGNCVDLP